MVGRFDQLSVRSLRCHAHPFVNVSTSSSRLLRAALVGGERGVGQASLPQCKGESEVCSVSVSLLLFKVELKNE